MNTHRVFASFSRCSFAALLLASLAPVGCVAGADEIDENDEDTIVTDDAVTGGTVYTLQGVQSNKCVGISSGSTAAGTTVDQWTCDGSAEQQWKLRALGGDVFELKAQHSGKCLDVSSYSYSNGAKIQQWTCNN
ncbi:MAG: RICIN domain-containing protein, partial [Byssovorax sp.]